MIGSALAWLGEDDPEALRPKVRAFEIILVLHVLADLWCYPPIHGGATTPEMFAAPVTATALAGVYFSGRWRRAALAGLAAVMTILAVALFPSTANHLYLQVLFLGLAASLDIDDPGECRLLLASVRWMAVVVLFYAGLQKLVHGHYFQGEFFAVHIRAAKFQAVLAYLLPADELARLLSYSAAPGAGPYRIESPLMLLLSNASYLAELGAAVLLLFRRTRLLGLALGVASLVAIEIVVRELLFGALFLDAMLLWAPGAANRRAIPVFAVFYGWLLLMRLQIVPEITFL